MCDSRIIIYKLTKNERTSATLKEKMESFDLKSWVTGRTKIRPGIPSQIDSNIL